MAVMYDRYGRRVPTPRYDSASSDKATNALVVVAVVLIIGAGVWALLSHSEVISASMEAERKDRLTQLVCQDSMSEIVTDDGHRVRLYVEPDVETGRQLVVAISDEGGVGICERPEGDQD